MRNNDKHVKESLKEGLKLELDYLEEKRKIEEEAKWIMGNQISKKMHEVTDARNDAYGTGKCF